MTLTGATMLLERRYGRSSAPSTRITDQQIIDYMLTDADDIDVGLFSRSSTEAVARFFKINEQAAYRRMNALAKKGIVTKQRDTLFGGVHQTTGQRTKAIGYQQWEYGWKPEDTARSDALHRR